MLMPLPPAVLEIMAQFLSVVDALERIVFHTNEEARGELRIRRPSIE